MTEEKAAQVEEEVTAVEATEAVDTDQGQDAEATDSEEKKEKAPKSPTVKDPTDTCREPSPKSKKGKVYAAGRTEEGGSMEALTKEFGCTPSNIRQHISQCHTNLGFGYKIDGDKFWITGDITSSWDDQLKVKAEAADEKKKIAADKKAQEKADAGEIEAPVDGTDSIADDAETPAGTESVPSAPEEDTDFLA